MHIVYIIYMYHIYTNLPENSIVRLPHPRSVCVCVCVCKRKFLQLSLKQLLLKFLSAIKR